MDRSIEFQRLVAESDRVPPIDVVGAAKEGDELAQLQLVSALVWAAFSAPDSIRPLYDTITAVWLGWGDHDDTPTPVAHAPIEDALWDEFWPAVDYARRETYVPPVATARVARISRTTHPDFLDLAERIAERRFGANDMLRSGLSTDVEELWGSCPEGSLGQVLHKMTVEGTYDLDIGSKRDMRELPPTLHRLRAYVDPLDGAWRRVAGYTATDSHLIAFAAFQLAQSGHLFSAGALALFASVAQFAIPNSLSILLHLTAEGWKHGRQAPSFLDIDWQNHWGDSIERVRQRYLLPTYTSVFSPKLFYALTGRTAPPNDTV